jgi:proteasome lid subunit RPN8/RPN11
VEVVADIHTHPGVSVQSSVDRENPMVATRGHIALIVPEFARQIVGSSNLGIYQYLGSHMWQNFSHKQANRFFYIGRWG